MTHDDTKQNLTLTQEPTEQSLNHGALRGVLASLEAEGAVRAAAEASRATGPEQVLAEIEAHTALLDEWPGNGDAVRLLNAAATLIRQQVAQLAEREAALERVRELAGKWLERQTDFEAKSIVGEGRFAESYRAMAQQVARCHTNLSAALATAQPEGE